MNKYLEKIAGFAQDFAKGWKRSSTTSKIGLGMSATGLGLGVANYANSVENKRRGQHMVSVEGESLNELKTIAEALKKRQNVNVHVKLPDQEKVAFIKEKVKAGLRVAKHPKTYMAVGGGLALASAGLAAKNVKDMLSSEE